VNEPQINAGHFGQQAHVVGLLAEKPGLLAISGELQSAG
jgi:hypothetical protein